MTVQRRTFLQFGLVGVADLLLACRERDDDPALDVCTDLAGATSLGLLAFLDEGTGVGVIEGEGLDGRLALDLRTLAADSLITSTADFFIRTRLPDLLDTSAAWVITIDGLVDAPLALDLAQLLAMPSQSRVVLLECSGNGATRAFGLISAAEWTGVPLADVLALVDISAGATAVSIEGFDEHSQPSTHSTPGCAWVFRLDELVAAGALLATHMNGEPLPADHGAPVRLLVPGWYGCCNPKWVQHIRLVDDSEPATSQMIEFAGRTHQTAAHALAKDYAPGTMQQAAMPIRVEQLELDGEVVYEIVGIMWGGTTLTDALAIRFNGGEPQPVRLCAPQTTNDTWTLWSYLWRPDGPGDYEITLVIDDPTIPTVRLDSGFYARSVRIE
jgi:DMSO/TMAO reductase YedYZ molybdopterin-dependent catalytic subunit